MKKILSVILLSLLLFTACEDRYLELEPLDTITEAAYFSQPDHFKAASNDFYNKMLSWRNIDDRNIYEYMDWGSDLTALTTEQGRGTIVTGSNDVFWSGAYKYIRSTNILLEKAAEYEEDMNEIAQYVATAKFFRAYHHFFLLQRFGGVPIVTTVLDLNSEELVGNRKSRYEVFAQVKLDLEDAIQGLPIEQNIGAADKGQISKWAAEAFLAKALLFEATWEMNVGTSTDGDGSSEGAGSVKPAAYPSTDEMLAQAVELAEDVMDNGSYELWNYNNELNNYSMYYLFNLEDSESNPAGLDKSTNKEYILYSKYDFALYQGDKDLSHSSYHLAPNRKMMDLFLCTDGLPVSKSPLFEGYAHRSDEYKNRDYRLLAYFADGETNGAPLDGTSNLVGTTGASGGASYPNRKFRCDNYGTYRAAREESYDYPHIRLAEVYLIYAEALYELNGSITDDQLNKSINKVKARSGLPALTNTFASANALDIREEIRRERAVELLGENNRFNDLKRWGIAEVELNNPIMGDVIEGTDYENNLELYNPSAFVWGELSIETGVGQRRAIILDPASNRNFSRTDYLMPIPLEEINLNSNLTQNPGY